MEKAQQYVCLDVERYNTLLKAHTNMGCLDETEKLTQEIWTKGVRANRVTFNELLHARVFASAGAGGRPGPIKTSAASGLLDRRGVNRAGASSLLSLPLPKRMTEFTCSFGTTSVGPLATNGGENGPLVGKREARDAELPSWTQGWLSSWLLRKSQLCAWLAENQRS